MHKRSPRKKFFTRKEIQLWFQPIFDFCRQAATGEVEAVRGYPITFIRTRQVYSRVDLCLEGLKNPIKRLVPDLELPAFDRVEARLRNGVLLTEDDIAALKRELKLAEDRLLRVPLDRIKDAVQTEMIAVEMRALMGELS